MVPFFSWFKIFFLNSIGVADQLGVSTSSFSVGQKSSKSDDFTNPALAACATFRQIIISWFSLSK